MSLKIGWRHDDRAHLPALRWDDLRAEPIVRTAGGGVPTREEWFDATGLNVATAGAGDIHLYSFTDEAVAGNEKECRFQFQLPHSWNGTTIHPHVHWVGAVAANPAAPRWGLQYTWAGIGSGFEPTKTIYSTENKVGLGGPEVGIVAGRHYMTNLPDIEPNTNQAGISSVLLCRLFRNSSSAFDTYTGKVGLLYFDIHVQLDGLGSRQEYIK